MEVKKIIPDVTNFLEVSLDEEIIDYLWKIVENNKEKQIDIKNKLVGNISKSFSLTDLNGFFYKKFCIPLIKLYRENNKGKDPVQINSILKPSTPLLLKSFWVNYQYQTEFNPYHDHNGVYSFAIWLKIPYSWEEQVKLPLFDGIKKENIKAGNFEFEFIDTLGGIRNSSYRLSSDFEGVALFFPASLRHCVYPFYGTDEPRISISGNLFYEPQ